MTPKNWNCIFSVLFLSIFSISALAQELILADGSANGQWYNPQRNGEGLFVEIIDTREPIQISVAWFTYDEDGNQMWLMGNVPLEEGQTTVTIPLFLFEGAAFGSGFDPDDVVRTEWGQITLNFSSCNRATGEYTSMLGFPPGTLNLSRLTNLQQVECIGPPPTDPVTPGTWSSIGTNLCMNVADDGLAVTSGDGTDCPNNAAFAALLTGQREDGSACNVAVQCAGTWNIDSDGFFYCLSPNGLVVGSFPDETSAIGSFMESADPEEACSAQWSASPDS